MSGAAGELEIIDFDQALAADFERLNQGKGVGRRLALAAIDRFRALDGQFLYLESHSSLAPALALYESLGFRHQPRPEPSEYERADIYMVWQP